MLPIVGTPFAWVALDIVGPLLKSSIGYQYILVIIDYTTYYPEAVPLRSVTAPQVADELPNWVTSVGIPCKILTEQGTNFMSSIMKAMCSMLSITHLQMYITQKPMTWLTG